MYTVAVPMQLCEHKLDLAYLMS